MMLVWDATVTDTLTPPYLKKLSKKGGKIAEQSATMRRYDYRKSTKITFLCPLDVKLWVCGVVRAHSFVNNLINLFKISKGEACVKQCLNQRIIIV